MISEAFNLKTEQAANNPGKPSSRKNPSNFSASQPIPNKNYTTATLRRLRIGARGCGRRRGSPGCYRHSNGPAGRRDRRHVAHGDRTRDPAEQPQTSDPARLARRRWGALAFSSAQSRRHRAETPAMLSRRGSAIAREKRLSCHTVRTPVLRRAAARAWPALGPANP